MKKKNKIILKLSIFSTLSVAGIAMFAVCGAPTYQWTNQATGSTGTYGAGWLNFENTTEFTNYARGDFRMYLSTTLDQQNIAIAKTQISNARYWIANSNDPAIIKNSIERINFNYLWLNTLAFYITSIMGCVMMVVFLPLTYLSLKKLLDFNREVKKEKAQGNNIEQKIIEEPIY